MLDIKVYDYEEYTGTQVVLPDGTITLPLIGRLIASDKTPDALTQEITARLQPLLKNPVVTIGINKLRPIRVNVAGEVQRPGPSQLQSLAPVNAIGSTNQVLTPTLTEALLQAGGVDRNADIRHVVLKRYSPNGSTAPVIVNVWSTAAPLGTVNRSVVLPMDLRICGRRSMSMAIAATMPLKVLFIQ